MIDKLLDIGLRIAPELKSQPLYILPRPDSIPRPLGVAAWADKLGATIPIQKYLESRGEWFGDGPTIIFCEPLETLDSALPIFLHELGHVLPAQKCIPHVCNTVAMENCHREIYAKQAVEPFHLEKKTGRPWRNDHGAKFIRRVLHLHARGAAAGYRTDIEDVFCARDYSLSNTLKYLTYLDDELDRFATASFSEIERAPMPTRFRQLFISDCRTYRG